MNIKVFGARVLITPQVSEEKTSSGLLLPEESKTKSQVGEVVSVGNGLTQELKVGDKVIYAEYGLLEVNTGSEKVFVLEEEDIIGKIDL